jgi:hypothetical protein
MTKPITPTCPTCEDLALQRLRDAWELQIVETRERTSEPGIHIELGFQPAFMPNGWFTRLINAKHHDPPARFYGHYTMTLEDAYEDFFQRLG